MIDAAAEILKAGYSNQFTSADLLSQAKRKLTGVEESILDRGWQAPDAHGLERAAAFPLDVFPEGLVRFCNDVCRSVPCPVDFAAVPALAVAGAAIGRSISLMVKQGWREEANLWTAIVGKPGTGKTPPLKAITRPLHRIFEEQLHAYEIAVEMQKQIKQERDAVKKKLGGSTAGLLPESPPPTLQRIIVGDTTSEALGLRLRDNPRGLVLCLDELAGLINGLNQYKTGGGGNDTEFYLALWSRASYPIDRKGQEGGIPIYVRSPFFGMTGGIQPDKLNSIGTTKDGRRLNDGFLDRFLFAYPDDVPMRWVDLDVDPEGEREWEDAVRRLLARPMLERDGYDRPFIVQFTAEARARYASWFDANCLAMLEADFPEEMKGPFSKVRAYCARIALLLEQLWWAYDPTSGDVPPNVSLRSVEGAIRLVEYFEISLPARRRFHVGELSAKPRRRRPHGLADGPRDLDLFVQGGEG